MKDISVKIMMTSISIKELKTMKHSTNKYAILFMYFSETNSFDKSAKAIIIKKVHLTKDLKANLLIKIMF